MAVSVSSNSKVGARLRRARAERGIDLLDAARETRIKPRFLDALERDAGPSAFPAPVYGRAFLREYARFLGLDPEPLVAEYRVLHDAPVAPVRLPAPVTMAPLVRWVPTIAVGLVVGALVSLILIAFATGDDVRREVEPPATAQVQPPPPVVPEARAVLRLRVVDRATWVQVVADGEGQVRRRLGPGASRTFRARDRIRIEVGDGGAVRLRLNGDRIGAPAPSGVSYRASFVLRDGEVRILSAR
jgi:transcriptional regulator with XRE-family HTH domain